MGTVQARGNFRLIIRARGSEASKGKAFHHRSQIEGNFEENQSLWKVKVSLGLLGELFLGGDGKQSL